MAWRCSAGSYRELLNNLRDAAIIRSNRVYEVMLKYDRKFFSPSNPYMDSPQGIGYGVTISAPHMHAHALEILSDVLKPGSKVLDVGSGSGFLTACFAEMVKPNGLAVGIEHIEELVSKSIENVGMANPDLMKSGTIKFVVGDGRKGYAEEAPYDAIHVGAAADDTPTVLIDQLKPNGRLICPVGRGMQSLIEYRKKADGTYEKKELMGVVYVPLTDRKQQLGYFHDSGL